MSLMLWSEAVDALRAQFSGEVVGPDDGGVLLRGADPQVGVAGVLDRCVASHLKRHSGM